MDIKPLLENSKIRHLLIALAVIIPFEIGALFGKNLPDWIEWPLFLGIIVLFGRNVLLHGLRSLFRFNFSDINLLMTIAIGGALYLGKLEEAAIIVTLFAFGETLEDFGMKRSRTAIEALMARAPKTAWIKGREERVPVELVSIGEVIEIRPGDAIPLDGDVIAGTSLVEEATITGEPLPKTKNVGDAVYAGTLNTQGYIEVRVTKAVDDTTLARIIILTEEAAQQKAASQRFIEQFAKYYTPAIILGSLALYAIPVWLFGGAPELWLSQALSLLIIACPCALIISTPIAVFSSIGNASRKGVLIKGGQFLEALGRMKAIAFDKTRTLTKGSPVVSDVRAFNGYTVEEALACAAGLEVFSEHPIAQSIVDKAAKQSLEAHPFENFQATPGKGVKGQCTICTDPHHCLGSMRFVAEEHYVPEEVASTVLELEKQGKTAIVISDSIHVKGVIGVTDDIRIESRQMVDSLRELGIEPFMLTGDNEISAKHVGSLVGITEIKAGLLPDDKAREMQSMTRRYGTVGMVGDGINDAPSLAAASVGIGMGTAGSDLALENADIALLNDRLDRIPFLVRLGRRCVQTIRFNIVAAIAVKALFMALAISGYSNLALAIFADVGMTVIVILNSLRLFNFEAEAAMPPS
ncbi:MAG: cadmium-translocating P-type ATPase [Synergistaceae bacterium]|nr:cadmium-translocating P-type ATPase [Synergistaceae bacterium]